LTKTPPMPWRAPQDSMEPLILLAIVAAAAAAAAVVTLILLRRYRREAGRLRDLEQRFHTLAESSYEWEYWVDRNDDMIFCSASCERISGHSRQEFIDGKIRFEDLIIPEDRRVWKRHLEQLESADYRNAGETVRVRIERPDGEMRIIEHHCHPAFDKAGGLKGFHGTNRDVTEIVDSIRSSEESTARFNALFFKSNAIMLIVDAETQAILEANPAARDFYGYSIDEMKTMHVADLNTLSKEEISKRMRSARDGDVQVFEFTHRTVNHGDRVVRVHTTPLNFGGRPAFFSIIFDITGQKLAERVKQDFMANISHEIRTPINGIAGMVQLARTTDDIEEIHRYLSLAARSVHGLARIMDSILEFSTISAEEDAAADEAFDLPAFLADLVAREKMNFESVGQKLELSCDFQALEVRLHRGRLEQVLLRLLSNALKFAGGRRTELVLRQDNPLTICVRDDGVGIAAESQDLIFEPFHQLESPYRKTRPGIGAGLAIVRLLVEKMHGSISLQSEPGKGSEFIIVLPRYPADGDAPREEPRRRTGGRHPLEDLDLLVIEDDYINRVFVTQLLESERALVRQAPDGESGLKEMREKLPDCLLLDIGLPGMSGYDVISEMHRDESLQSIPVIAITAHAHREEVASLIRAGVSSVITKPYQKQQLIDELARQLGLFEKVRR
jgi:PAS domain S-box-containing protein